VSVSVLELALALLGVALLLALLRAVRGPTLPDRVVALELTSMITVSILLERAIVSERGFLLDAAIVLALVAFIASVSFAYYLERRPPE
jgi:multicomponent Na+:H+ antiporter subunit F